MDYNLRTPVFELECVRLAWYMNNIRDVGHVCMLAARIVCPDVNIQRLPFLNFQGLRDSVIKLDMMHMLCSRVFRCPLDPKFRTARYLTADSSPQGRYDYFCCVEEIIRRPLPLQITVHQDPFSGFSWDRRSLPVQTIGRKKGSVAVKVNRLVDALLLEYGHENIWGYRLEMKGWLSDQGVGERGIPKSPFGDAGEIAAVVHALKEGTLHLHNPRVKDLTLFMNCLEQPGALHINFNALENAFLKISEWGEYVENLRAIAKILGDPSYKEMLLEGIFKSAFKEERSRLHKFPNGLVDFKWEHLELILSHVVICFPILRKYYKGETETGLDGTLGLRVTRACACAFFLPFSEFAYMICNGIGVESSWFEGCYCHEVILKLSTSGFKRRREMVDAAGTTDAGHCPWKGKRLVSLAMGHRTGMCERVRSASSSRYKESLLAADIDVANRILVIEHEFKESWCMEVFPKFAYAEVIPWKVAGGFSAYCGYSLYQAKQCIRECFDEFAAIDDRPQTPHHVSDRGVGPLRGSKLPVRLGAAQPPPPPPGWFLK